MDNVLKSWLRPKATMAAMDRSEGQSTSERFSHPRLDQLFEKRIEADKGAQYAKYLHLDLSTLSPYVSGPNSVKVATLLVELKLNRSKSTKLTSCHARILAHQILQQLLGYSEMLPKTTTTKSQDCQWSGVLYCSCFASRAEDCRGTR
jgi:aconitase A